MLRIGYQKGWLSILRARGTLEQRLAAHDDGMDLLGMDVTWTAEFAEAGWIRELTPDQKAQATKDRAKAEVHNAEANAEYREGKREAQDGDGR